jgi:hypothetical protein
MLEHLPWIIAGLFAGLIVGYAIGRSKGADEIEGEEALESETDDESRPKTSDTSSQKESDSVRTVYIRRGGSHYHREGCPHLRHRGGQPVTTAQARKKGFRRCPDCRP